MVFGYDSQQIVYIAQQGANQFVVLDGQKGEECVRVWGPTSDYLSHAPVFSANGRKIIYVATSFRNETVWKWHQSHPQGYGDR
jgi:hypothetical protein